MKKALGLFIISISAIVAFAASAYNYAPAANTASADAFFKKAHNQKESYKADVLHISAAHLSFGENIFTPVKSNQQEYKYPLLAVLISGYKYKARSKSALQYLNFASCLIIRNRKADLIFPFHYFW